MNSYREQLPCTITNTALFCTALHCTLNSSCNADLGPISIPTFRLSLEHFFVAYVNLVLQHNRIVSVLSARS